MIIITLYYDLSISSSSLIIISHYYNNIVSYHIISYHIISIYHIHQYVHFTSRTYFNITKFMFNRMRLGDMCMKYHGQMIQRRLSLWFPSSTKTLLDTLHSCPAVPTMADFPWDVSNYLFNIIANWLII